MTDKRYSKEILKNLRKARKALRYAGLRGTYADMLIAQQIYRIKGQ